MNNKTKSTIIETCELELRLLITSQIKNQKLEAKRSTINMLDEERIPLKRAEISIQKFNDVGIPHHLSLLRNHKSNIKKCLALGDWDKIQKEEINATRVVKQLKTLLMEMDSLRSKLIHEDVKKFDELILTSRQSAMAEMKSYMGKCT